MNLNFDGEEHDRPDEADLPAAADSNGYWKRDRFELLSAYLDGEVTAAERHQVEQWLEHDPEAQAMYARLMRLRQGMRSLSLPTSEVPVEQTVEQVFSRLERRPRRAIAWGGAGIAAALVGALATLLAPDAVQQVAQQPQSDLPTDGLMIALDRPVVDIPTVGESTGNQPAQKPLFLPEQNP